MFWRKVIYGVAIEKFNQAILMANFPPGDAARGNHSSAVARIRDFKI